LLRRHPSSQKSNGRGHKFCWFFLFSFMPQLQKLFSRRTVVVAISIVL
jgi:hypothetical protein